MKLNTVGRKYLKKVENQLKLMNLFVDGDAEVLLFDMAIQYQKYVYYLELAEDEELDAKNINIYVGLADKFYKNVLNTQKSLGITPMNRAKLKVYENENTNEGNMLDALDKMMKD